LEKPPAGGFFLLAMTLLGHRAMTDRRPEQLEKLRREHGEALEFSRKIAGLAAEGSDASVSEGIRLVRDYYQREMEAHLQQEEQTLFGPLLRYDRENMSLCMRLGKEHGLLRTIVAGLRPETAQRDLAAFSDVLREHTLTEEEQLLPLVESLFTPEQLDSVMNFVPLPWASIVRD
jgi:hemerythrin-like domain-containing protein